MNKSGSKHPKSEVKRPVLDIVFYSKKDKGDIRRNVGGCWDNEDGTFKGELNYQMCPERLSVFPRDEYTIPWLDGDMVEAITGGANKPVCDLYIAYERTNKITGDTRKRWYTVAGGYPTSDMTGLSFDFGEPVVIADFYIRRRKTADEIKAEQEDDDE